MRTIDDFTRPLEYISPIDKPLGNIFREWVNKEVIPSRRLYDEDWKEHSLISGPFKKLLGEYGIQRILFPEDLGGWGLGHSGVLCTASQRMFEEIARADSGMAVAFGVVFWPLVFIAVEPHVNRRLCEEFAPLYMRDEPVFAALAMTEPQGGSDIENVDVLKGSTIETSPSLPASPRASRSSVCGASVAWSAARSGRGAAARRSWRQSRSG